MHIIQGPLTFILTLIFIFVMLALAIFALANFMMAVTGSVMLFKDLAVYAMRFIGVCRHRHVSVTIDYIPSSGTQVVRTVCDHCNRAAAESRWQ